MYESQRIWDITAMNIYLRKILCFSSNFLIKRYEIHINRGTCTNPREDRNQDQVKASRSERYLIA
jgi:hypothetical protein